MFWFGDGGFQSCDALGECQRSRKESNGDGRPLKLCWYEGTGHPATQAFPRRGRPGVTSCVDDRWHLGIESAPFFVRSGKCRASYFKNFAFSDR